MDFGAQERNAVGYLRYQGGSSTRGEEKPPLELELELDGAGAGAGAGVSVGPAALAALLAIVLGAFAWPFLSGASAWGAEWAGFVARAGSSQFTLLALFDLATCLAMISAAVLYYPLADPSGRRREEARLA